MKTPSSPPPYRPNLLHWAVIISGLVSRIPPAAIAPALAGMAAIAAWPWRQPVLQATVGGLTFLTIAGDGVSLWLLPRRGRSFGTVTPPLLALALLRAGTTFLLGILWPTWPGLGAATLIHLGLTTAHLYATWIEPFRIATTHLDLTSVKVKGPSHLRVLQVSDIHFEGWTPRERQMVEMVREIAPDLILLTGDYLNLSSVTQPGTQQDSRDLLGSIASVAPTYAITGSPPVDRTGVVPEIYAGLPITWLLDETVDLQIDDHTLRLVGVRCTRDRHRDGPRLQDLLPQGDSEPFTILLYHSPDLMPDAVKAGVNLYLAGHTHGGQLRLPLFGAIVTSSDFWKRYEAGQYQEGTTTLYVSRGVGMEGMGAPRARFLAPPELVLLTLRAEE